MHVLKMFIAAVCLIFFNQATMAQDQYFKELHVMNIHEEMMPRNVNDSTRKRELWPYLGGTALK